MTPPLELRGVRAAYERVQVLHGVDLVVPAGSLVALLGPNGAGKSTTLKVIGGLVRPTGGSVLLEGREVTGVAPQALSRAGVCLMPEGRAIFPNLTVRENLLMASFVNPAVDRAHVEEVAFERFPVLGERAGQIAGTLSGGEQQMLALARALATDPAILLLDEISMGLAPKIVASLFEVVSGLARQGLTILMVEQFASHALEMADYVVLMTQGRVQAVGEPADVESQLVSTYLGAG